MPSLLCFQDGEPHGALRAERSVLGCSREQDGGLPSTPSPGTSSFRPGSTFAPSARGCRRHLRPRRGEGDQRRGVGLALCPAAPRLSARTCCLPPFPSGLIALNFTPPLTDCPPSLISASESIFYSFPFFFLITRSLLFFTYFFKIPSALCCPAIPLRQGLFSPCHAWACHSPLPAHTFLPCTSASPLPWQGPILLSLRPAAQWHGRGKTFRLCLLFSLCFPVLPPALCPFPRVPHALSSPARERHGLCGAIPGTGCLQDTAEEEGFAVRGSAPRRRLGKEPCSQPPSPAAGTHSSPRRKPACCFPLFFLGPYLHAYDRFTVILLVYD